MGHLYTTFCLTSFHFGGKAFSSFEVTAHHLHVVDAEHSFSLAFLCYLLHFLHFFETRAATVWSTVGQETSFDRFTRFQQRSGRGDILFSAPYWLGKRRTEFRTWKSSESVHRMFARRQRKIICYRQDNGRKDSVIVSHVGDRRFDRFRYRAYLRRR
jgi:hypothetical protein